jgi:type IV secretion system protein VirB2
MQTKSFFSADKTWSFCLCLLAAYATLMVPSLAHALPVITPVTPGATIGNLLCNVANWFTGPVGQGIATLAIITVGLGALMGKVSWGMAIIVGLGVAVIFGAPAIVSELGTTGTGCLPRSSLKG